MVNENTANVITLGTVFATDPDAGQTYSYSIISGNTNGAFANNSSSGAFTVVNLGVLI